MKDISILVQNVLDKKIFMSSNEDYNIDLVYNGAVSKRQLSELIKLATVNVELEGFLCQIVDKFINSNSVDINNFNALLHYNGKCRRTLLWNLSGNELEFYQMSILFERYCKSFPEVVSNMLSFIYKNDCFSDQDMAYYIKRSNKFDIRSIINVPELIESIPTNSKTKLLLEIL